MVISMEIYLYQINNFDQNTKIQIINHTWDISNINLSPEDEIHFTINLEDNNIFKLTFWNNIFKQ